MSSFFTHHMSSPSSPPPPTAIAEPVHSFSTATTTTTTSTTSPSPTPTATSSSPHHPPKLPPSIMKARERRGECPSCGVRTHKIRFLRRRTPLTVPGVVFKGRCELCHIPVAAAISMGVIEDDGRTSSVSTMASPFGDALDEDARTRATRSSTPPQRDSFGEEEEDDEEEEGGVEEVGVVVGGDDVNDDDDEEEEEGEGSRRSLASFSFLPPNMISTQHDSILPSVAHSITPHINQDDDYISDTNSNPNNSMAVSAALLPFQPSSSAAFSPPSSSAASEFNGSESSSPTEATEDTTPSTSSHHILGLRGVPFWTASPPSSSALVPDRQAHDVSCSGCSCMPIEGVRYKCLHCREADFCSECVESHPVDHVLLRLTCRCPDLEGPVVPLPPTSPSSSSAFCRSDLGVQLAVHDGVACALCKVEPIVGNRYRDLLKSDADYCRQCLSQSQGPYDVAGTGLEDDLDDDFAEDDSSRESRPALVLIRSPIQGLMAPFSPEIIAAAASSLGRVPNEDASPRRSFRGLEPLSVATPTGSASNSSSSSSRSLLARLRSSRRRLMMDDDSIVSLESKRGGNNPSPTMLSTSMLSLSSLSSSSSNMKVVVRSWYGKTILLYGMEPKDTVKNLKVRIQLKEDIPAHKQSLFFEGRTPLEDRRSLEEYNIGPDSVLSLTPCLS